MGSITCVCVCCRDTSWGRSIHEKFIVPRVGSHALNGTGEQGLILDPTSPALRHRWAEAEDGWIHAYLHFSEPSTIIAALRFVSEWRSFV